VPVYSSWGVDALRRQAVADIVAGDGTERTGLAVVNNVILQLAVLIPGEALDFEAGAIRIERGLVAREDITRVEPLEGVCADEERKIGKPFDEIGVVEVALHEDARNGEEDGGIAEARAAGNPVVGLGGWR